MCRLTTTLLALTLLALPVSAQTGSKVSLQVSGLASVPFGGGLSQVAAGAGFEAQLRYSPSLFSIGGGFEFSSHSIKDTERSIELTGAFVEPRYVIVVGSESVAPYLSGRLAFSQTSFEIGDLTDTASGYTVNVGGGLLFVLGSRANFDLGATFGVKKLGLVTVPSTPPTTFDLGNGQNVIFRAGLAIGLGG